MDDTLLFMMAGSVVGLCLAAATRFRTDHPAPAVRPPRPEPRDG